MASSEEGRKVKSKIVTIKTLRESVAGPICRVHVGAIRAITLGASVGTNTENGKNDVDGPKANRIWQN
jgi:hypothetical protein